MSNRDDAVRPESVEAIRERLLQGGIIEERDDVYVFQQDYLFPSPCAAAATVLGASANGWVEWKDEKGQTLSDVFRGDETGKVTADSN